jgi:hypothetical protein
MAAAAVTGAPLHIAHLFSPPLLRLVADAQARGMDVTTECYPYETGALPLQSAIFDPGWRERMNLDYGDLTLTPTGERLTEENFNRLRKTQGQNRVIYRLRSAATVTSAIANPVTMIISDGNRFHPRQAGSYSRVLGKFVREEKALSLADALRKMTLMPAKRVERRAPMIAKKGRIRVGADADLTLFDPEKIIDRATLDHPAQASEGVRYVLVNGVLVIEAGKLRPGIAAGRPIRAPVGPAPR